MSVVVNIHTEYVPMARNKDPEIKALQNIIDALDGLEPPAQSRILRYVDAWAKDQTGIGADAGYVGATVAADAAGATSF